MNPTTSPNPAGRPIMQPCGTWAAYKRHVKRGEEPCFDCADAARVHWQNENDRRRRRLRDPLSCAVEHAPPPPGPWALHGACRGMPPEWFHPERGQSLLPAKQACAGCPVTVECLDYALDNFIKFGVWGGTSERERRKLRRDRKQVAA